MGGGRKPTVSTGTQRRVEEGFAKRGMASMITKLKQWEEVQARRKASPERPSPLLFIAIYPFALLGFFHIYPYKIWILQKFILHPFSRIDPHKYIFFNIRSKLIQKILKTLLKTSLDLT